MANQESTSEAFWPFQIVDYAEVLLSRRFPKRVVKFGPFNIPSYSWPGAGSEKGGSSGHLSFEKIIFANPEEKDSFALAVGRKQGRMDTTQRPIILNHDRSLEIPYSPAMYGIFRVIVPNDFVKEVIDYYRESMENPGEDSNSRNLDHLVTDLIADNFHRYYNILLFAFDERHKSFKNGFFRNDGYFYGDFKNELTRFEGLQTCGIGTELANDLADRVLEVHPSDETVDLSQPQSFNPQPLDKYLEMLNQKITSKPHMIHK